MGPVAADQRFQDQEEFLGKHVRHLRWCGLLKLSRGAEREIQSTKREQHNPKRMHLAASQ
jgi:hypothetical protein